MGNKCCLVIIMNHRFEQNIPKIKKIYGERFSTIKFLVPFYQGSGDSDIISVYDSSYNFHNFVAQSYHRIVNKDYIHYIFLADDAILNPEINENNYDSYFQIDDSESVLDAVSMDLVDSKRLPLRCYINVYDSFNYFWTGVHHERELPSAKEAFEKAALHGYGKARVSRKTLFTAKENMLFFYRRPKIGLNVLLGKFDLPYPIISGFSDFYIVSNTVFRDFAHMCGVLASMNLQVELATHTAMVLVNKPGKIKYTKGENNVRHGREYTYKEKYGSKLALLYQDWPKSCDYIHPIKLSDWEVE